MNCHLLIRIGLGLGLLIPTSAVCAQSTAQLSDELQQRANVVRPTADELKWQRIPWVLDLSEGQRQAREERRPIFLWVTGDDPLQRC